MIQLQRGSLISRWISKGVRVTPNRGTPPPFHSPVFGFAHRTDIHTPHLEISNRIPSPASAVKSASRKTENSNFALLSTIRFTQPFNDPISYARNVASLANLIAGGGVLVQRLGDLENGRRTEEKRLAQSSTRPTMKAVPGDLSLCMPKRQLDNIIETLDALDKVAPGTANYDTLLYGVECKYYSSRPSCHDFMIEGTDEIYALGDGAGFTRSLSQAAANGLIVADIMNKR